MQSNRHILRDAIAAACGLTLSIAIAFVLTGCRVSRSDDEVARFAGGRVAPGSGTVKPRLDCAARRHAGGENGITNSDPASLVRSEAVIQAKIARKNASGGKKRAKNPGDRFREWYADRAGDDGVFTFDEVLAAKAHIDQMPDMVGQTGQRDAGIWNWEWLGPGNIGGRIRSILIHPTDTNKMWIGAVSGGIWRTTNGGASWSPVNDFLPSLAVCTMVMHPMNPDIMYAGTGEGFYNGDALPGAGVFKTTDGGSIWTQLPATAGWQYVNRLAIDPTDGDHLLAATRAGIYRSDNGGDTWFHRTFSETLDIKFSPANGTDAVAGMWHGAVSYTRDGGDIWRNSTFSGGTGTAGRVELAYAPSAPDVVYASMDIGGGTIWWSWDGGENFAFVSDTGDDYLGTQGSYDNVIWVNPSNPNTIVVGGIDLWRSVDHGKHFDRISDWSRYHTGLSAHADQHVIVEHPGFDGSSNRTVFVGNDGGIQKADDIYTVSPTDGWTNLANNLGITQFYAGATSPDGAYIIGGTQDNDALRYRSVDGAQAWFQAETGDGGYCAIDYDDPNNPILYTEYVHLAIEKSVDGGNTYAGATTGLTDAGASSKARFIAPFSMDPNNGNTLVAGGTSIWRTTNSASNWTSIRNPIGGSPKCTAIDIASGDYDRIWVGYEDGSVSRTTTQVTSWTDVDDNGPTPLPNRTVTDIAINPHDPNEVFVTFAEYNTNSVWHTVDNGVTWQVRAGTAPHDLPALQVNTVRFHPTNSNWIYIGTDLGVFASEDRGVTWSVTSRYNNNEGPVNTEVSELFWQGDEHLIAATHGRGMYRVRILGTVYIDRANTGYEDGSQSNPYDTVREGIDAAGPGTNMSIKAGDYNEVGMTSFSKRGTIVATNGTVVIH